MIAVSNIQLAFGGRHIFDGVSFLIGKSDKIGLVGRNGAGKSTLMKVVKGLQPADGGDIMYPRGTLIGYLPQNIDTQSRLSVSDEAKKAFEQTLKYMEERDRLVREMEERTDYESDGYMDLINRLQEVEHQIEIHDGYRMDEEIERVLKGLGFDPADFGKKMSELSGGWQMRVELAKILLQKPDLIMLDEPTNHLDIESVLWLEEFLKDYPGAVMMVSHDRQFLDNITSRTIEVTGGEVDEYPASYSGYLEMRKERREQQMNAFKNQQREIARIERNIERFKAKASKASFAQSLVKKLDKMEVVEIDEEDARAMDIRFPEAQASGKVVATARKLSRSYGEKVVLRNQEFDIMRGDKIAFVGKNGMGKSTLSKILVGDTDYTGDFQLGHQVTIGFYAQHAADTLDGNDTVLDTVDRVAVGDVRTKLRDLLGCFLFTGDDVFKKVKVLSGGEKSRLALCRMILEPRNFLVLDEPTNHLDMLSKEILKRALQQYKGTVVVVSHDREFLRDLASRIFEFTPNGIREFPGNIDEFLEFRKKEDMRSYEQEEKKNKPALQTAAHQIQKSTTDQENKKLRQEVIKLEESIRLQEEKIASLESKLNNPLHFKSGVPDQAFYEEYEKSKSLLDILMKDWEQKIQLLESGL